MKETIFKINDRVFDIQFGWGEVFKIDDKYLYVEFDEKDVPIQVYYKGKERLLSFAEYTLNGFSQERLINYKDYIGKWGKFYDKDHIESLIYKFGKLQQIRRHCSYKFKPEDSPGYYEFFEPLTEEQIEILGLTNKM